MKKRRHVANNKINKKDILKSRPRIHYFFLFTLIIGIVSTLILLSGVIDIRSKAEGINTCRCNDPNRCYPDQCSRDNKKDPNVCPDNDLGPAMPAENNYLCYVPPDCCNDLVAENNAYRCCWVERGFCRKDQCSKLTGPQARCGWYWDDHTGEGYGCSRVTIPVPSSGPTNTPIITATVSPTGILVSSTPIPTVYPSITPTPTGVIVSTVTPIALTNTPSPSNTPVPTSTPQPTATPTVTSYPTTGPAVLPKTPPDPYPKEPICLPLPI